ncbi:hypothetical protein Tco_0565900 [Tanacetum coccineum]
MVVKEAKKNIEVKKMSGGAFGTDSDAPLFDTLACSVSRSKSVREGANTNIQAAICRNWSSLERIITHSYVQEVPGNSASDQLDNRLGQPGVTGNDSCRTHVNMYLEHLPSKL